MAKFFARAQLWLAVALSLVVTGCTMPKPDPGKEKEAREIYDQFARGDYAGFEARLSPEARASVTPADLQKLYAMSKANVPTEPPKNVANVRWTASSGTKGSSYTLVDDYEYATKYIEVTIVLVRPIGASHDLVQGFNFNIVDKNKAADHDLTPKTPLQFALAAVGAAILLVTLTALVQVFTRKGVKRRWLWLLFILVGFGGVKLNWGTGALVAFMPINFQLLSLGVFRGLAITSPWIITFSVPVGALTFLSRAKAHAQAARLEEQRKVEAAQERSE